MKHITLFFTVLIALFFTINSYADELSESDDALEYSSAVEETIPQDKTSLIESCIRFTDRFPETSYVDFPINPVEPLFSGSMLSRISSNFISLFVTGGAFVTIEKKYDSDKGDFVKNDKNHPTVDADISFAFDLGNLGIGIQVFNSSDFLSYEGFYFDYYTLTDYYYDYDLTYTHTGCNIPIGYSINENFSLGFLFGLTYSDLLFSTDQCIDEDINFNSLFIFTEGLDVSFQYESSFLFNMGLYFAESFDTGNEEDSRTDYLKDIFFIKIPVTVAFTIYGKVFLTGQYTLYLAPPAPDADHIEIYSVHRIQAGFELDFDIIVPRIKYINIASNKFEYQVESHCIQFGAYIYLDQIALDLHLDYFPQVFPYSGYVIKGGIQLDIFL